MLKKLTGVMIIMFVTTNAYSEGCVTVQKNGTYTVDPSGCIEQ